MTVIKKENVELQTLILSTSGADSIVFETNGGFKKIKINFDEYSRFDFQEIIQQRSIFYLKINYNLWSYNELVDIYNELFLQKFENHKFIIPKNKKSKLNAELLDETNEFYISSTFRAYSKNDFIIKEAKSKKVKTDYAERIYYKEKCIMRRFHKTYQDKYIDMINILAFLNNLEKI